MEPFFWRVTKNFGDYMNNWLWPKLFGDLINRDDGIRLVGIGSYLKAELNYVKGKKIIFGSGAGYGPIPPSNLRKEWIFYFVRGPLTAKLFDLDPNMGIVDGSWLISQIPGFEGIPSKNGISFIPHWTSAENGNWEAVCNLSGFQYIDPTDDFEYIIKKIASSEIVITEALHGAILSDYFRTPWIPIKISPSINNFKWIDWCSSIDVDYNPAYLPPSDFLEHLYHRKPPTIYSRILPASLNEEANYIHIKEIPDSVPVSYKHKTTVKSVARKLRSSFKEKLKCHRNLKILSGWNSRYMEKLSVELKSLSQKKATLSRKNIRAEKIEKLNSAVEKLRKDYRSGIFIAD